MKSIINGIFGEKFSIFFLNFWQIQFEKCPKYKYNSNKYIVLDDDKSNFWSSVKNDDKSRYFEEKNTFQLTSSNF